jgi:hypothetical protein
MVLLVGVNDRVKRPRIVADFGILLAWLKRKPKRSNYAQFRKSGRVRKPFSRHRLPHPPTGQVRIVPHSA